MPMRTNCRHYETRSYGNGETVRKCNLDLAPEAPWRCPDDCPEYTPRRIDVAWDHGSLGVQDFAEEPESLGEDESIAALLDAAEDIVNAAGPDILMEMEAEKSKKGRRRRKISKKARAKKRKKGKKR
ncbi:MAG: hypothetical protein CL449_00895 [Acidimicrobiaceae bacterium]|jgi:hypothetical protein|nr:hypothetical protein [Acidimicrobiaceae bacterium]MCH2634989.1 hypothetical protein [Acidimicrobiales bacterium]|tara:strand:+ start:139 stop:519 length:381 start_codon:yes stop_codon:yes gene_type:complete